MTAPDAGADAIVETARVVQLSLGNFRCFEALTVELAPGLTVLFGANGVGKTSVLEAVAWAGRGRSFRGVPDRALVRAACDEAILRVEVAEGERRQLLEVAIRAVGPNRVLLNRNRLSRTRDLSELLRVTVFSPDDLDLVKGARPGAATSSTTCSVGSQPATKPRAATSSGSCAIATRCCAPGSATRTTAAPSTSSTSNWCSRARSWSGAGCASSSGSSR